MNLRPWALGILITCGVLASLAPAASRAETVEVQMTTVDFEPQFVPSSVSVHPGDTVRWINMDPFLLDHSTASGTGSADPLAGSFWNSGILPVGESFEVTFEEVGDYEYFSVPHEYEGMFGVVHVTNTTGVPDGSIEATTWGKIKRNFSLILPRD